MPHETELAELIRRTAVRDRDAFHALYEATSSMLMGIALKILGRHDLAEEAVQDVYVTIWRKAEQFDPSRGSALGWISIIARRRAVDRLRASPWLRQDIPNECEMTLHVGRLPEALTLRSCLEQLNTATRYAICLAYLYGLSHDEISRLTGIPLGTIKSRLRRGLVALRKCLDQ